MELINLRFLLFSGDIMHSAVTHRLWQGDASYVDLLQK